MPHPDSLSGIGTSRTTTPDSNDIQVIACSSVPSLPRLAMRLTIKDPVDVSCTMRTRRVFGNCLHHGLSPPLLLHACNPTVRSPVQKERQVECSSPSMDQ